MAALTSADVTVTVEERTIEGKKRRNRVKITFGDGTDTYPSGGVPLPTYGSFGMIRNLDYLILTDANDGSGYVWKYDQENNKLRAYIGDYSSASDGVLVEATTSEAPAAQTLYAEAVGW